MLIVNMTYPIRIMDRPIMAVMPIVLPVTMEWEASSENITYLKNSGSSRILACTQLQKLSLRRKSSGIKAWVNVMWYGWNLWRHKILLAADLGIQVRLWMLRKEISGSKLTIAKTTRIRGSSLFGTLMRRRFLRIGGPCLSLRWMLWILTWFR